MLDVISLDGLRNAFGDDKSPFVLRTSDRMLFKRCRRLWAWMSHLRQGRVLRDQADYLWFGTGIHYALEDYHGLNLYGHPASAYMAYVMASRQAGILPATWQEHQDLGVALMQYYADHWLARRPSLQTYEVNGIPQVEVNGAIDLDVLTPQGRRVLYGFTIDRVIIDEWGRLWIVEYKTAKQIRLFHFDVDEQITAYCWTAWKLYGKPVAGVIYQQFKKNIPTMPKVLATGRVSTDSRQQTTAALYQKMLNDMYGDSAHWPPENVACYNKFCAQEDEHKDKFIVRHHVERNHAQLLSFEQKVLMELEDIANENLALYPNATKDCDYLCPLQAACLAMDDGSDFEAMLDTYSFPTDDGLTQREKEQMKWRTHLPEPSEVPQLPDQLYSSLEAQPEEERLSPEQAFLEELRLG